MGTVNYTKKQEYLRSIEMLQEVQAKYVGQSKDYFLLAFLYDSQYTREDIKAMMDLCKPETVQLADTDNSIDKSDLDDPSKP